MELNEVAPPGFGHTKSGKGDKKGGTAAAFDRARKEGRFKGSKSDMFAIMWSQKNKGDKPHYKPGTNKKYKKYQEELIAEKDLNAKERRALPDKDFVFAGKGEGPEGKQRGAYPIPDKKHARNALAMAAAHASPEKQAKVKAAVKKKFPDIKQEEATYKQRDKELKKTKKAMDYRHKNIHKGGDDDVNEQTSMKDNNLFGNAYAGSKKDATKNKPKAPKFNAAKELVQSSPYMKPALQQVKEASFKDYMAQAQAARDREKKRREDRKKSDAQYSDTRKHGVRFYDKKGRGRIKSGKKVYD